MDFDFINEIVKIGEIYLVGGATRNYLYNIIHDGNIPIKDFDFIVRLIKIDDLNNILSKYGITKQNDKFGILILSTTYGDFEFALPRTEQSLGTGYRDFEINFHHELELQSDCIRRDATINAIYLKLTGNELLNNLIRKLQIDFEEFYDPYNGISDIRAKIWRCIGEPDTRFKEDPTRIMRALRQSTELNLRIEKETIKAIRTNVDIINTIIPQSYIRLFNELFRIIKAIDSYKVLHQMDELGILNLLIGKVTRPSWLISDRPITPPYTNVLSRSKRLGSLESRISFSLENDENKDEDSTNSKWNNIPFILKVALLIRPEFLTENIKQWANQRQITATNYIDKTDINVLIIIQDKYDFNLLTCKYDVLKYLHLLNTKVLIKHREVFLYVLEYNRYIASITETVYQAILTNFQHTENYPQTINELQISGDSMIKHFKLTGKQIKQFKEELLNLIYQDKLINEYYELFTYITNKLSTSTSTSITVK